MLRALRRSLVTLAAVAALAAPAAAEAPFSFDRAPGRLPKDVVPLAYTVAIVPHVKAMTLDGTERVTLQVRKPVTHITFNTLNQTLSRVMLDSVPVAAVKTDNRAQLTTLTLARAVAPGVHTLSLAYRGKLETAPQGLFVQPYQAADGSKKIMLSTQFEATEARRVLPVWDEPAFRSTFALTATVPAAWSAVSNMPVASRVVHGALATTTFRRSPKMPSYLLEFSAGDLARISGHTGPTQIGIWATRGNEQTGRYALANAQQILGDYNAYFGYPFPLPKLDSIAVPGGFEGAMENWGAITYNDQALLLPRDGTTGQRQTIYSIQAHEMAHQWNGDLVTMGWWDDIWLNESFASWMAAKETDLRNPTWHWWEGQDGDKEFAMNADARLTAHPIQIHVTDELQAEASMDPEIAYSKGQAFLRMLEAYLGPDTFRAGVRTYIKARAFSNATSADLWNGLSAASHKDVAAFAAGWTEQPGFPLISVASACDASGNRTVTLSQQRFLLSGTDPKTSHWDVPLDVKSGNGAPRPTLLARDGQTVAAGRCGESLSLNADDVGYFRVAYDAPTLEANRAAFASLPDSEKIPLLDDQYALVRSGKAPLSSYLGIASAMGSDRDARAWGQILGALEGLEYDERGGAGYAKFVAYARSVIKPLQTSLGWDPKPAETPDVSALRRNAIRDLGVLGDPDVVAESRRRFAAFVADRNAIRPDDQGTIMTIVAANGDQAAFDQLHAVAKSAKDQATVDRWYPPLAEVRDPKLAQQVLDIAVSSEIPPQDGRLRFELVAGVSDYNPQLSWQFLTSHTGQLFGWLSGSDRSILIATEIPQIYWNSVPADELQHFVETHVPANASVFVAKGMDRARSYAAEKQRLVPEADAYLASR